MAKLAKILHIKMSFKNYTVIICSVHQVKDHLRDYLDRSYRVLVENQAEVADQNLYLLIIQCFEVCVCVCVCVHAITKF